MTKPLTEYTPSDLRTCIDRLHADRERYQRSNRIIEIRSCDLDLAEATRALAILNRRATEALDSQQPDGITQREVDELLASLCYRDDHEEHALVTRMWTAIQTMQTATREQDLREAWMAGHRETVGHSGVTDCGAGPSIMTPSDSDAEEWAAEYARCKVGG